MPNLLIENVDLEQLEKQRLALSMVLSSLRQVGVDGELVGLVEDCEGLLNMLDHWSDKVFVDVRVCVKEWFDKANGNSYFSAKVWVEDRLVVVLPFQYGYEEHGVYTAIQALAALPDFPDMRNGESYWKYCQSNQMRLVYDKKTGCLKRDVTSFGEE